jgi:hypothetical protein
LEGIVTSRDKGNENEREETQAALHLSRVADAYRAAALFVANTLVFVVVVNLTIAAAFGARDLVQRVRNPVSLKYEGIFFDPETLSKIYPDLPEREVHQLLEETWSRPYVYEAFTQFKERPFRGEFVNVDDAGFRFSKNQRPWPPSPDSYNVFTFGGSTTFGYGLPDEQTVPSYLQDSLQREDPKVAVYNFGRGGYFSTQERILFERLLADGRPIRTAIFVQGLNDFHYYSDNLFPDRYRRSFDSPVSPFQELIARLPIMRLVTSLTERGRVARSIDAGRSSEEIAETARARVDFVIDRYVHNLRMIRAVAREYGVSVLFVWQPVPTYRMDIEQHLFAKFRLFQIHPHIKDGYPALALRQEVAPLGKDFAWCADIQEGVAGPLYVDQAHYTARLSSLLADCIVANMRERGLAGG